MGRTVTNVHAREIAAPAEVVGRLLDRLGSAQDALWPSPQWMPMRFDRPLAVGADGGHGGIRYVVTEYQPGRRVQWRFHPSSGLVGTHEFLVEPRGDDRCVFRHQLVAQPRGAMRLWLPLIVRACHDTVIEHTFDNAQRAVGLRVVRPAHYPWLVRLASAAESARVRAAEVPAQATLLAESLAPPYDLADAVAVHVPPGTTLDPQEWTEAIFRRPPGWVLALLHLRNALGGLLGVERADASAFDTLCCNEREVVVGTDAGHLDFRASVLVEPDDAGTTVTLSTLSRVRNRSGGRYLAIVRHVHPWVVRAMLRRAALAAVAPPAPQPRDARRMPVAR